MTIKFSVPLYDTTGSIRMPGNMIRDLHDLFCKYGAENVGETMKDENDVLEFGYPTLFTAMLADIGKQKDLENAKAREQAAAIDQASASVSEERRQSDLEEQKIAELYAGAISAA